ncbi:exodeoxyribonuclease I, partial [Francisella tularensis subsp. holarctica]|nr:exodeoxyribonuclease I [Francisella tularensis subsp. holarctica]
SNFNIQNDENTLTQLYVWIEVGDRKYKQAIAVSGIFGSKNNFISAILDLGQHQHYKNQEICLRLDSCLFSDFIDEFGSL